MQRLACHQIDSVVLCQALADRSEHYGDSTTRLVAFVARNRLQRKIPIGSVCNEKSEVCANRESVALRACEDKEI